MPREPLNASPKIVLFFAARIRELKRMIDADCYCHTHAQPEETHAHSRRSIVIALACSAVASSGPALAKSESAPEDERFMHMALDEARQGDYAFGCVIVRGNNLIARGRNLGKTNDDPTAHGEMVAIRRALADHGSAALRGATLYTSGELCIMCMGADRLVRYRPAGLCRLGPADRPADETDHDHQC
jgi:hypothetical protein